MLRVLFIGGSLNQTTMMHAIARHLPEADCSFTAYYGDGLIRVLADRGWLDFTILGGKPRRASEAYLRYLQNDFPQRGYVLAATSCLRETFKPEDRRGFIRRVLRVAGGRPLLFKLHPNEDWDRARREIEAQAPQAQVLTDGNTNHMIANCEALVTRYSSVALVAMALGKEVYADIPLAVLRRLTPLQNGGTSARRIADVCRECLN